MHKSRKALLLLSASAVILAFSLWLAFASSQPHYQGRSLTSWLLQYEAALMECKISPEDWPSGLPIIPRYVPEPAPVPAQAVRDMSNKALPLFVKWIRFRQCPWKASLT